MRRNLPANIKNGKRAGYKADSGIRPNGHIFEKEIDRYIEREREREREIDR